MRPQAQSKVIPQARFRRAPSRCQRFWQGILILATLALAVAANAQSACYDMFAGPSALNAPLRRGNSVTIHYTFSRATPEMLADPTIREEVRSSAVREARTLEIEGQQLRLRADKIKGTSKKALNAKVEAMREVQKNRLMLERVRRIEGLAEQGETLSSEDLALVNSHPFTQTIVLSKKADAQLLTQRLEELDANLATFETSKIPESRIKRIYRVVIEKMKKHKIVTLILVSAMATTMAQAGHLGYDLYVSHQNQAHQGVVTQIYDPGLGGAPTAPARDNPQDAIGN